MNIVYEGNGNGHGAINLDSKPQSKIIPVPTTVLPSVMKESGISFLSPEATRLRGTLVRMTRHRVFFELYTPDVKLRLSEVLSEFKIIFQEQPVYFGRAVVCNLVDEGTSIICEATLEEADWKNLPSAALLQQDSPLAEGFKIFLQDWQKLFKVSSEFKVVVADMQTLLYDLRLWLDQIELGIQALPKDKQAPATQKITEEAGRLFVPVFDALHEKLELISATIGEDLRPAHRVFVQRQLHALMLCSPFGYRAYAKPLGYAGDYEMVNMIALDPYQGGSLFAKIVNFWFLSQWPSKAHRNRLTYLQSQLENETLRREGQGGKTRIFNFACGPALEIQRFLAEFRLSKNAELTLADFSQETLEQLSLKIGKIKEQTGRAPAIQFQRKNIVQVLKEGLKKKTPRLEYDFVYCAGLFDYLSDSTCRQLMEVFYSWLAPDGLLVVTNVVDDRPFRHMLEFVLDWNLIYRDTEQARNLFPNVIPLEARSIKKDPTGVNIFIEARKLREQH